MGGGRAKAGWAVVLGALAAATLPAAVVATRYSEAYELLHAGFAIPVAIVLGGAAIAQARKVRARGSLTLEGPGGSRAAAIGRLLGIAGICSACSALIALAVYGVLTYLE